MLNPNLSDPLQVLHKLEREMHRAFHHQNYVHKSDHLINFCVTGLSLKDYVLNFLGLEEQKDKQPYYDEWSKIKCLRAASEIANSSKHCGLDKPAKTKDVEESRSNVINVFINDNGEIKNIEENVPDYKITLEDNTEYHLYEFTRDVIDYWKEYISKIGIKYVEQESATFFGDS